MAAAAAAAAVVAGPAGAGAVGAGAVAGAGAGAAGATGSDVSFTFPVSGALNQYPAVGRYLGVATLEPTKAPAGAVAGPRASIRGVVVPVGVGTHG